MKFIKPDKYEYFPFVGKITFKGINYLTGTAQKNTNNVHVSAGNHSNVNVINNSSYAILNEASSIIESIKKTIEADHKIESSIKNEIKLAVDQLSDEIKSGKPNETTFNKLLRVSSGVASIGSFVVNLTRLFKDTAS